jgi:putative ABC transport system permease protein
MRRLALKNLQGRKAYSAIIVAAVAAAVIMTLFTLFMTGGVRQDLENNRRMLGPDLAVVPKGSKAQGLIYLSKGPPAQAALPEGTRALLADFSEIDALSPQKRLGDVTAGKVQASLIAFDPATDCLVPPWLDKGDTAFFPGRDQGLMPGARVDAAALPASLSAAGGTTSLKGGRLLETGVFMDTSVFIPRPLEELEAAPSWILLRLRRGVSPDIAANRLEVNIPGIEVIPRPELFKTINDQLHGLLEGGGFGAAALLAVSGAMLVTGAMFALMAHERKREFGLLKAMGAKNSYIFSLIMSEAAFLGCAGALAGTGLTALWLLCAHTGLTAQATPVPPLNLTLLRDTLATLCLTVAVSALTALYPALAATRLEPYAAIRGGE